MTVDDLPSSPMRAGRRAIARSVARTVGVVATAPLSIPALAVAARRTAVDSLGRIDAFGDHLRAVAQGAEAPLPAPRTRTIDGGCRWVVTSDLHRSPPGRFDWPERQGTKELYRHMLRHYAEEGWGLVENGDVEDFWLVGATARAAMYDIGRIATGVEADGATSPDDDELVGVLHDTVAANEETYRLLREGFVAEGRYHRTVGNHDEAYLRAAVAAALEEHLAGAEPVDTLLLTPGGEEHLGIGEVDAVISHGHLTDSWNGPGYSPLGRAITWLALVLAELGPASSEELPDEEPVEHLLDGRGRNRLITLDPRFGGNRRFDSLDEERLFTALDEDQPPGGWPWIVFGHTHYPMLRPTTRRGGTVRYANSGCGVLRRAVSALEWDPAGDEGLTLVLWVDDGDGVRRVELVSDGGHLAVRQPDL